MAVVLLVLAVFLMVPVVAMSSVLMISVLVSPLLRLPMAHTPAFVPVVLWLYVFSLLSSIHCTPEGSMSVTVTCVAVSGPLLVAVMVYIMYVLLFSVYVFCVCVTPMSAAAGTINAHDALLLLVLESY